MKRYCILSYPLDAATALYPGTEPVVINRQKGIAKGDSCNTCRIILSNHSGTHIETTRHFYDSGKFIDECSAQDLVFSRPLVVNCPKERNESISRQDFETHIIDDNFDLLIIRTGFSKYRSGAQSIYSSENPYMLPETARWIRERFSGLRAIAIDCISFSSVKNRDIGREVHKIFLQERSLPGHALFLIEDIFITSSAKFKKVRVFPLFSLNLDASPCVMIGEQDD